MVLRFAAVTLATVCLLIGDGRVVAAQVSHELEVTVPGGFSARLRAIEGSVSTLEHGGRKLGFDVRRGGSTGTQIEVRHLAPGSNDTRGVVSQVLELPGRASATTYYGWTVAVLSSRDLSEEGGNPLNGDTCCVRCGDIQICSCAAELSCGKCCVGSCCEIARAPWQRETELASLGLVWARDMYRRPCPAEHSLSAALSFVRERQS